MKNFNFTFVKSAYFPIIIYLLLIIIKLFFPFKLSGPTYFFDEYLYLDLARKIFNGQIIKNAQYPPLYSIFLSVVFFSKTHWYRLIIYINIILSSLLVFPVWLLSKKLLSNIGIFLAVIFSILLPIHVAFPGYIISENLYIPAYIFSIYLLIFVNYNTNLKLFFFGFSCALCYLTRYIFLPSFFIFLFIFSIDIFFLNNKSKNIKFKNKILFLINNFIFVFLGFIFLFSTWTLYCYFVIKIPIVQSLGLTLSGIKNISQISFYSILLWIVAYSSYLFLSIFYFIAPVILFFLKYKKINLKRNDKKFIFTILLLTATYLTVAIQHSLGSSYNYPTPKYIIGRYISPIIPLLMVFGIFSLEKLYKIKKTNYYSIFITSFLSLFLIYFSYQILYNKKLFFLPDHFARIIFNSPDIYYLSLGDIQLILLISIFPLLIFFTKKTKKISFWLIIIFFPYILFQLWFLPNHIKKMNEYRAWGIHGRFLTPIFTNKISETKNKINFISSNPWIFKNDYELKYSLISWGFEKDYLDLIKENNLEINIYPTILLSENLLDSNENLIQTYNYYGNIFYIYFFKSGDLIDEDFNVSNLNIKD